MIENLPAIIASIVFLIVGIVSAIQPDNVKIWMNKGNAETLHSDENKIYFVMVRFFGLISIAASGYIMFRLILN